MIRADGLRASPARWLALAVLVAVALAAGAWMLGRELVWSSVSPKRAAGAGATSRFVTVQDPGDAFELAYPSSWRRLPSTDPQVVLLATAEGGASLLVRKTPISAQVSAANLAAAKKLADHVVRSGDGVSLLRQPQQVVLGGLPGYLYLYTFTESTSGERGAHAHYFLFQRSTMITLVFQAMPASRILSLAHLFDRIAATFHALPG